MMNQKISKSILVTFLLFLSLIYSCEFKKQDRVTKTVYDSTNWKSGRELFRNNCSQCHVPNIKDEIFGSYYELNSGKSNKQSFEIFSAVLQDTNHTNKNIGHESMTEDDLRKLLLYILTPQRNMTID